VVRNQAEKILRDSTSVKREEFEAVKDMARLAREEKRGVESAPRRAGSQARRFSIGAG